MKAEFGNLEQIKLLQKEQRQRENDAEYKKRKKYSSPMEEFIDVEFDLGWHEFAISNIYESMNNGKALTGLDKLIDDVTGASKGKLLETAKLLIQHLAAIKRLKTKLNKKFGREYNVETTVNTIAETKKIIKQLL